MHKNLSCLPILLLRICYILYIKILDVTILIHFRMYHLRKNMSQQCNHSQIFFLFTTKPTSCPFALSNLNRASLELEVDIISTVGGQI